VFFWYSVFYIPVWSWYMGLAKEKYQSDFGTTEFSKSKSQSGIPNAYTRSWWWNGINNHIFIIVPAGICNDPWYQYWIFLISISFNSVSTIVQELKGCWILTHCSSTFQVQRTFVALHLELPTPQKFLNSVKGTRKIWGVWCNGVYCLVMGELK